MPRKPRKQSSTDIYHVVNHGVHGTAIFVDDADRRFFVRTLEEKAAEHDVSVYAWCLMDNHFHLLVRSGYTDLSAFVQAVTSVYATRFNLRHDRKGYLFMQRFRSEAVETEGYLLNVVRYIHQNPVKAFMCPTCDYPWSSFNDYVCGGDSFVEKDFIVGCFGGIEGFTRFHAQVSYDDACLEVPLALDDGEALVLAGKVLGEETLACLHDLVPRERNIHLRALKNSMIPLSQISRITGFAYELVRRA